MDLLRLESLLAGTGMGRLRYLDQVSSTNEVAMMWIGQGAPDWSLVVADEQTAGRGRFDRRWVTNPGAALAFSAILRPAPNQPAETAQAGLFSPLGALAVAQALEQFSLQPQIKWPNDVLLNGKKVCGILVESAWMGTDLEGLVIGIGLNVTPASVPPAEALLFPATCVEQALGQPVDRWSLLREILVGMREWRQRLGQAEFFDAWERKLAYRGEWVRIGAGYDPAEDREGRVEGIDRDGSLRLQAADGSRFSVQVGEVHLRPASSQ